MIEYDLAIAVVFSRGITWLCSLLDSILPLQSRPREATKFPAKNEGSLPALSNVAGWKKTQPKYGCFDWKII